MIKNIIEDKENDCITLITNCGKEYMLFDRDNKSVTNLDWIIKLLQSLKKVLEDE